PAPAFAAGRALSQQDRLHELFVKVKALEAFCRSLNQTLAQVLQCKHFTLDLGLARTIVVVIAIAGFLKLFFNHDVFCLDWCADFAIIQIFEPITFGETENMQPLPIRARRAMFEDLVTQALDYAKSLGATDAAAEISEGQGLSVSVRLGSLETVEQTRG